MGSSRAPRSTKNSQMTRLLLLLLLSCLHTTTTITAHALSIQHGHPQQQFLKPPDASLLFPAGFASSSPLFDDNQQQQQQQQQQSKSSSGGLFSTAMDPHFIAQFGQQFSRSEGSPTQDGNHADGSNMPSQFQLNDQRRKDSNSAVDGFKFTSPDFPFQKQMKGGFDVENSRGEEEDDRQIATAKTKANDFRAPEESMPRIADMLVQQLKPDNNNDNDDDYNDKSNNELGHGGVASQTDADKDDEPVVDAFASNPFDLGADPISTLRHPSTPTISHLGISSKKKEQQARDEAERLKQAAKPAKLKQEFLRAYDRMEKQFERAGLPSSVITGISNTRAWVSQHVDEIVHPTTSAPATPHTASGSFGHVSGDASSNVRLTQVYPLAGYNLLAQVTSIAPSLEDIYNMSPQKSRETEDPFQKVLEMTGDISLEKYLRDQADGYDVITPKVGAHQSRRSLDLVGDRVSQNMKQALAHQIHLESWSGALDDGSNGNNKQQSQNGKSLQQKQQQSQNDNSQQQQQQQQQQQPLSITASSAATTTPTSATATTPASSATTLTTNLPNDEPMISNVNTSDDPENSDLEKEIDINDKNALDSIGALNSKGIFGGSLNRNGSIPTHVGRRGTPRNTKITVKDPDKHTSVNDATAALKDGMVMGEPAGDDHQSPSEPKQTAGTSATSPVEKLKADEEVATGDNQASGKEAKKSEEKPKTGPAAPIPTKPPMAIRSVISGGHPTMKARVLSEDAILDTPKATVAAEIVEDKDSKTKARQSDNDNNGKNKNNDDDDKSNSKKATTPKQAPTPY